MQIIKSRIVKEKIIIVEQNNLKKNVEKMEENYFDLIFSSLSNS